MEPKTWVFWLMIIMPCTNLLLMLYWLWKIGSGCTIDVRLNETDNQWYVYHNDQAALRLNWTKEGTETPVVQTPLP